MWYAHTHTRILRHRGPVAAEHNLGQQSRREDAVVNVYSRVILSNDVNNNNPARNESFQCVRTLVDDNNNAAR